jgi:hypothetical protein
MLMAHAYKAIGECAARDFGCGCFSAPDQETKIELFSRSAVRDRCRLTRRGQCARDVRQRPTRAIEGGPRDDRSGAAERPLTWRAGLVTLPEPRRRPRTLLLALLAGLSCAHVSCVQCDTMSILLAWEDNSEL